MNITPELWTFDEILGSHSLLPILAAICRSTLVKTVWTFFSIAERFELTVTWLLTSTPAFKVILLSALYWLLKLGGIMNQNMLLDLH
jgi:hypothetical protein